MVDHEVAVELQWVHDRQLRIGDEKRDNAVNISWGQAQARKEPFRIDPLRHPAA
jgi:hypothetical protein